MYWLIKISKFINQLIQTYQRQLQNKTKSNWPANLTEVESWLNNDKYKFLESRRKKCGIFFYISFIKKKIII